MAKHLLDMKDVKNVPDQTGTRSFLFQAETGEVADKETLRLIHVDDLFGVINHTSTATGAAFLYRSLIDPPVSGELVRERQESLLELSENPALADELDKYISLRRKDETNFYDFVGDRRDTGIGDLFALYKRYNGSKRFISHMTRGAKQLPSPGSPYLSGLIERIREDRESIGLMTTQIYLTPTGIKSRKSKKFYNPGIRFVPRYFKILSAAPVVAVIGARVINGPVEDPVLLLAATSSIMMLPFCYVLGMIAMIDGIMFADPLRKKVMKDEGFKSVIDAYGEMDQLLSFHKYSREESAKGRPMALPKIRDSEAHYMLAEAARNPYIDSLSSAVPNDIDLSGQRITFVTGPNSGGKTTYCKTVAQLQLLGQIGCYLPAESAEMTVADRIFYHAPQFDSLRDEEGRFGTELKRTRDIFKSITPRSLVVLDELAEGTTYEEKLEQSHAILDGFYTIGNNTVLVTHNHELARRFAAEERGQYRQVELRYDNPTYKIAAGISTVSHADRVARKLGFSADDIKDSLARRGYLK